MASAPTLEQTRDKSEQILGALVQLMCDELG